MTFTVGANGFLYNMVRIMVGTILDCAAGRVALSDVDAAFASDDQVILFPAGQCSRKTDGIIQDRAWSKAFLTKSLQTDRQVVPIHFFAQNSKSFYRWDRFFKLLRIKANLTMLLLPGELYKGRHATYRIRIGKPIPPEAFDASRSPMQWAQWVRAEAYKL